jgi:hypothetical protein
MRRTSPTCSSVRTSAVLAVPTCVSVERDRLTTLAFLLARPRGHQLGVDMREPFKLPHLLRPREIGNGFDGAASARRRALLAAAWLTLRRPAILAYRRQIQSLAGHQSFGDNAALHHLSPASGAGAVGLLERRPLSPGVGDMLETA